MTTKTLKIGMANAKGGVGKTCSTQNVSHALANKKKRVLCVDFDPQASLTHSFGIKPHECALSIADVLFEDANISDAIVKTGVDGVDLLPGSLSLSSFDISVSDSSSRDERLKTSLDQAKGYDYILVDTAPTASLMMVNALLGVDRFIIPVVPQYLCLEGLATMMDIVERIRSGFGKCADLMGILLTQVDYRSKATHELVGLIRKHYGKDVFNNEIRVNVRLSEAPSFGKTVFQHDWASSGAEAYRLVADEILKRTK